jgi:hypothetical protein
MCVRGRRQGSERSCGGGGGVAAAAAAAVVVVVAAAAVAVVDLFFWDFTRHRLVVCYRCFETTCWSNLQGSSSPRKM